MSATSPAPTARPACLPVSPDAIPRELTDAVAKGLLPEHRRQLEVESAIPADILAEEGIYSLRDGDTLPVPDRAFRHPNSYKGQRFPAWPDGIGSAIVFPHRDAHGRSNVQLRPDVPRRQPKDDGTYRTVKYEHSGGARHSLYVPTRVAPRLANVTEPIRVTEGDKKTLALAGRGYCAVGLSGVDCWTVRSQPEDKAPSEPLPDLDDIAWRDRIALIEFDSDAATNPSVRAARGRLGRELRRRGAAVVYVDIPPAADGSKQGVDDFLAAGGDLRALENAAIVAAITAPTRLEPPTGTDGEGTCRDCAPLREQVTELKAELRLLRSDAVPPAEALVLAQLATIVASAQSRGETIEKIYVPDVATHARVAPGTVTRALNQVRRWQRDPHLRGALPFAVEDYEEGGKAHVRLLIDPIEEEDRRGRPRRAVLQALGRMPRDDGRAKHGGAREACPKCDSPMLRTTEDRCTNDTCNHVVVHPSTVIGRPRHQDDPGRVGDVAALHGATFVTAVQADEPEVRHQDGPVGLSTFRDQDDPGPLIPVSFVSDDDRILADSPHYRAVSEAAEAPPPILAPPAPPAAPLPPAPPRHRAYWSRPEYRQRHAAGTGGTA